MKRYHLFAIMIGVLVLALGACAGATNVTFSQLLSQADRYNGKTVTLDAFYFGGWEISVISESVGPSSASAWRIVPVGTQVWVENGIPQDLQSKLLGQSDGFSGYTERLGKLRITGRFETGGSYGHLDGYRYRIAISKAELLDWSPPPGFVPAAPAGD